MRRSLLAEVGAAILSLADDRITRVAVDGVDGAGKTCFADELADVLRSIQRPVIRASVDGFHNPRNVRYRRGRASPEGFYHDSYNAAALRRYLLDPLGPQGSRKYRTAVFDHTTDTAIESPCEEAAPNAVLIFDGIFAHRPKLRECWDFSIFLDVPFEISIPRGASRGPGWGSPDPNAESNRRYIEGQKLYLRECEPRQCASILIDNSDLSAPRIVRGVPPG